MTMIEGLSNEAYHRSDHVGSSSLKMLATKTPAHYQWNRLHHEDKPQFIFGSAAHAWILEGDADQIVVVDSDSWRTKAAKEARDEAYAAGKYPLLDEEFDRIDKMRAAILDHPIASQMVNPEHRFESSIFWEEDGMPLKCRPDALGTDVIWDLKTARSSHPGEFGRAANTYGYHQSAAHYIDGVRQETGKELPFRLVLIEKEAPFFVSVVEFEPAAVDLGSDLNAKAKDLWRTCTANNHWPGYEGISVVDVPAYAYYEEEDDMIKEIF